MTKQHVMAVLVLAACASTPDGDSGREPMMESATSELTVAQKQPRYVRIRDSARARGITKGYLLAGIANDETGLAMCWSEATWACKGPASPDCGNGPIIAGSADGACSLQQGGLGMFQFDAGTYAQTIAQYGSDVLTVEGQVAHAIDFSIHMVKISAYTTNAETDAKAKAWINNFDPSNATLRDQWIKTVVRYYNGCPPTGSCWAGRYRTYSDGLNAAINEPGGLGFWSAGGCTVGGAILAKYNAVGGAGGVLGACVTSELTTPDGVGRYNHFQNGSIYWTPSTGAFEVHGNNRAKWEALGWETGVLGYPTSDELATPDGVGRFNHFQGGSIYWTAALGSHEVHGNIHAAWAQLGWETGALGYPTTDEQATPDGTGRFNRFERGNLYWTGATGAREVVGQIFLRYGDLGWENSALRYPTTGELATCGGRANQFQGGAIYWTAATGAHEVLGAAQTLYASMQGPCGALGFPTAAPIATVGGQQTRFQHGTVVVDGEGVASVHLD